MRFVSRFSKQNNKFAPVSHFFVHFFAFKVRQLPHEFFYFDRPFWFLFPIHKEGVPLSRLRKNELLAEETDS